MSDVETLKLLIINSKSELGNYNHFVTEEDIKALTAAIELMEEKDGWISVNDRLPNDARPVIIDGGCGHYSHKYKGWFTNMDRDYHGEYLPIQWEVTHWMPLPIPPKHIENQDD